jgi:CRISPR/Cas system-associated endonuclease/helicase Cas3
LEKRNKRKQIKQKEEEETKVEETEQNPEVSQSINNQREDYLCNYNDNPQCYSNECKGFGMNGRPFEFDYTPETDINWKWNRC